MSLYTCIIRIFQFLFVNMRHQNILGLLLAVFNTSLAWPAPLSRSILAMALVPAQQDVGPNLKITMRVSGKKVVYIHTALYTFQARII